MSLTATLTLAWPSLRTAVTAGCWAAASRVRLGIGGFPVGGGGSMQRLAAAPRPAAGPHRHRPAAAARALARRFAALSPMLTACQRENALGAEKPSWSATSVSGRSLSST